MDTLQSVQEEIGERLCTLTREKLIELCQFLKISAEDIRNTTHLSLVNLLSNHLLRKELEELEDGGMAELLSIDDKLSDLMMTDINVTELRTDLRPPERGESLAQRQLKQPGNASESLSAMYISPDVSQSMTRRQITTDNARGDSTSAFQRQITPAMWHKDLKISGLIGEPGQKDRLSFSSLKVILVCQCAPASMEIGDEPYKSLSKEEIRQAQRDDMDVKEIIDFIQSESRPSSKQWQSANPTVRGLMRERDKLVLDEYGILHRKTSQRMQLVLPAQFKSIVLR